MDSNNKVEFTGRIAKFPKNTKAKDALQFLERIKVNPNKLWYIIVEDQGTDLKMVKYNRSQGVNLLDYTADLKMHYLTKYANDASMSENIRKIEVIGENDFSVIKNIPPIILEGGHTLLSKITMDLVKLLADDTDGRP